MIVENAWMLFALNNEKTSLIKIGLFHKTFSPPRKVTPLHKRSCPLPSHNLLPRKRTHSKNRQKKDQLSYKQLTDLLQPIDCKFLFPAEVESERHRERENSFSRQQSRSPSFASQILRVRKNKITRKTSRNPISHQAKREKNL